MRGLSGRPVGIVLISALLAINGIASLLDAFGFVDFATRHSFAGTLVDLVMPSAVAMAIVGLIFLYRAYGFWNLRQSMWLSTMLLVTVKAASGALHLVIQPPTPMSLALFALPFATAFYLLLPDVRRRFSTGLPSMWLRWLDNLRVRLKR